MTATCNYPSAFRRAFCLLLPILLLQLIWAVTNPPGAAPDEPQHLVKALGMARFDAGSVYTGPPARPEPWAKRNAASTRIVEIPARLNPLGFSALAFKPLETADILPHVFPDDDTRVAVGTYMGAYPPFFYVPLGLAAARADHPPRAFLYGRLVSCLMSSLLLLAGAAHLIRVCGTMAVYGIYFAMTPMAVFSLSYLSACGVEIAAATAVACVTAGVLIRPDSIHDRGTFAVFTVCATALVLSRQLGLFTLFIGLCPILFMPGMKGVVSLAHRHPARVFVAFSVLLSAVIFQVIWKNANQPIPVTGGILDFKAYQSLWLRGPDIMFSMFGNFGWLDTLMPEWAYMLLACMHAGFLVTGILLGGRYQRTALVFMCFVSLVFLILIDVRFFYPIHNTVQGRHMLPFYVFLPVVSGALIAAVRPGATGRIILAWAGVVLMVVQFVCVYWNGRRYAVGTDGPWFYLASAKWAPAGGWYLWVALTALVTIGLGWWILLRLAGTVRSSSPPEEPV